MKRSNFPNFRAFDAVVSKRERESFRNRPGHGYHFCGNLFCHVQCVHMIEIIELTCVSTIHGDSKQRDPKESLW